ncbi:MAG: SDR family oxidoreductase [Armatimonadetes bacterium]|nr:SDR family oxidoreductase [Armatimonadota bacterium]
MPVSGPRCSRKVALVTGGGGDIGAGVAIRLAAEGSRVAVGDVTLEAAEATASQIDDAMAVCVDVRDEDQVKSMVEAVESRLGRVDILINCAGISPILPLEKTTVEIWDAVLDINLRGTFLCCREVLPGMAARGYGKIVNISSQSGKKGNSWYAAYCASKFGVIGLTQSIAVEYAPFGININAVCPGVVFTKMWEDMQADYAAKRGINPDNVQNYLTQRIPLGRLAIVEDVANVVAFLVSDESSYMTGQAINVTGGVEMG